MLAEWDAAAGKLTVSGAAKVPFFNRRILAKQIGLPEDAIEMIENDVGGGFGARGEFYPEDFLIPFAARHVDRPVKWTEDRREHLMAMNHAREAEGDIEIACARDGTILALRGEVHIDMGAYMRTNGAVGARNVAQFMAGPYRVPHVKIDFASVDDQQDAGRHLSRAGPLRGQLLSRAADRHGGGRSRHRPRRVAPAQSGHAGGAALSDRARPADRRQGPVRQRRLSGDVRALPQGDRLGRESEARRQADRRRYHGLGVVCFIEGGAAGPKETARLAVNDDGTISVYLGTTSVGQGVETIFAQIAADALEIPIDRIRHVYHGSTGYVSDGYGAYHSRSTVMGGSALLDAAEQVPGRAARGGGRAARLRRRPRSRSTRTRSRVRAARSLRAAGVRRPVGRGRVPQHRSTPTATARMRRMSRSIPSSGGSRSSTTSWSRMSAAPSIR